MLRLKMSRRPSELQLSVALKRAAYTHKLEADDRPVIVVFDRVPLGSL